MIYKMDRKHNNVLKSCARCRKHKTRCDGLKRKPLPCTNCYKRNLECIFDVKNPPKRLSNDIVENLTYEVKFLQDKLDGLIDNKMRLINMIIEKNPSIHEIQKCLESPIADSDIESDIFYNNNDEFKISSDKTISPVSLSLTEAEIHFLNYSENFNQYLPIIPSSFFDLTNITTVYKDHNLLFWSIILTSHLNNAKYGKYSRLARHVKSLVVENCWLKTPRSIYIIISLLILVTWPIPMDNQEKLNNNLSMKYLSLIQNLSLQLGLHRLEFIEEFSHKTNINLSDDIRERIYKFITINSNYWLVNLGLLNLNFNGFEHDFVINKAIDTDLYSQKGPSDNYTNLLLKISIIQTKFHENLINDNNLASRLINLNMFEVILNDLKKLNTTNNNLVRMSIEFSKVQLFSYYLSSNLHFEAPEYRASVNKTLSSCYKIIELFSKEFPNLTNLSQLPIHYKFIVEFVSLLLVRIYHSPLLGSIGQYETLKTNFKKFFTLIDNSKQFNMKLYKLIMKFNEKLSKNLVQYLNFTKSFYLLNKFNNYQVSNIYYEMIWSVYSFDGNEGNWADLGIDPELTKYLDALDIIN